MTVKSCLDCQHCKTWHISATREDPDDAGYNCSINWPVDLPEDEFNELMESGDCINIIAETTAANCSKFEVKKPYISKVQKYLSDSPYTW